MKALRWHNQQDIRLDEIPIPRPAADEVLLRPLYSGICGSEVHEYIAGPLFIPLEPHPLTQSSAPQILGHEFGGYIEEVGKEVHDLQPGDLVTVNPILSCGACSACQRHRPSLCDKLAYYGAIGDGGHAEYTAIKAANCMRLPPGIPGEYVAFGEPAGVAYHAVNQGNVTAGNTVVVLGGGPIGQLVAQYARYAGASRVFLTEIAPARIQFASQIGAADTIVNPLEGDVVQAILEETDGEGVDVAIECSGGNKTGMLEDTAAQAIELTRTEGTTVIVGTFPGVTELHFNNIVLMERKILGSWAWHSQEEYRRAMELIVDGTIEVLPLVSARIQLQDAVDKGIEELQLNKDEHLKILIDLS